MSKYDSYWQGRFNELVLAMREAAQSGDSTSVDVSDLKEYGSRKNWHGIVEVYDGYLDKGEMVHAGSLGKIVERSGIVKELGVEGFSLVITSDLKLYVRLIPEQKAGGFSTADCWWLNTNKGNESNESRREESVTLFQAESLDILVEILKEIPESSWEQVNWQEPEWKTMYPFIDKFGYGPFSVLMLVTGLNDFQLKGRAEIAYWPCIKEILDRVQNLRSPKHLSELLEPFYRGELSNRIKVNRLNRFLNSKLAERMWLASPDKISEHFTYIWQKLADIMKQKAHAKTIVFAMKCLGLSLLMVNEKRFDFSKIPIPVDYRIKKFTQEAGLSSVESEDEVRLIWQEVLERLQEHNHDINMIALDSLIWQLAGYSHEGMKNYLAKIGAKQAGKKLADFMVSKKPFKSSGDNDSSTAALSAKANQFLNKQTSDNSPVFCFIPCCAKKCATGKIVEPEKRISEGDLPDLWANLVRAREVMQSCIKAGSPYTTALHLYTGMPYSAFSHIKTNFISDIQAGKMRLFIISAGYGIIDALEPINNYDAMLRDKVAMVWHDHYLSEIIAELLLHHRPAKVYGFFAGKESWAPGSSMYRYFYSTGLKLARKKGLKADAGCFYRQDGMGVAAILGALGRSFIKLYQSGFDDEFINNAAEQGIIDDNVTIGFKALN